MTSAKFSAFLTSSPCQNLKYTDHATSLPSVRNCLTPLRPEPCVLTSFVHVPYRESGERGREGKCWRRSCLCGE